MKSKVDIRKQLEAGLAVFLSEGKLITKVPASGTKKVREPKQKIIEIDVEHLPAALRTKHFGE